jgi:hypothetical protein
MSNMRREPKKAPLWRPAAAHVAGEGEEVEGEFPAPKDNKVVPLDRPEPLTRCSLPQLVQNVAADRASTKSVADVKVADNVVLFWRVGLDWRVHLYGDGG